MSKKSKSRKSPQAVTAAAKEDARLTSDYRKRYKQYDDDVARYGVRVADFNAGFIAGAKNEARKHRRR
jgi:hypothetical protein